jgi:hypothetical protein
MRNVERLGFVGLIEFLRALEALISAIDANRTVEMSPDDVPPQDMPPDLEDKLIINRQRRTLTWIGPAPTDAEREMLANLGGNELFQATLAALLKLYDEPQQTPLAANAIVPAGDEMPPELQGKLTRDADFLRWSGPAPTDREHDALLALLGINYRQLMEALLVVIDGTRQTTLQPAKPRPTQAQLPASLRQQMQVETDKLTWTGRVHAAQQEADFKQLAADRRWDAVFTQAVASILNELMNQPLTVPLDLPLRPHQADLPESLAAKLLIGWAVIRYHGLMTTAEGQQLQQLYAAHVPDQKAIQRLYAASLNRGLRGRELRVRTRRGSATPSSMVGLQAQQL